MKKIIVVALAVAASGCSFGMQGTVFAPWKNPPDQHLGSSTHEKPEPSPSPTPSPESK